jgi:hypothetical protein
MTKLRQKWIGIVLLVAGLATLALGRGAGGSPAAWDQTAPTLVPTAAISLSPTADLSGTVDNAETPGELLVAYIVFSVVGFVVAVTIFLVWQTRPSRRAVQSARAPEQTGRNAPNS